MSELEERLDQDAVVALDAEALGRTRVSTISLDYSGDTVINSAADIAACLVGWLVARHLPWRGTLAIYLVIEVVMLATIRDSLLLNVLMLLAPIEAVKTWQTP